MACARGYFDACGCETRIRLPDNPGSLGTRESCTGCRATTISRAAVDDDVAFSQLHPRRRDTCTLQPEDKPGCSTAPLQFQSSEVQPTTSTNVELDKGRPDPRDTRAPIGFSTSDVVRPRKLLVRNTYSTTISSAARAYALGAHVTEASWQSSSFHRPAHPSSCELHLLSPVAVELYSTAFVVCYYRCASQVVKGRNADLYIPPLYISSSVATSVSG
jgi:hypothetical protein